MAAIQNKVPVYQLGDSKPYSVYSPSGVDTRIHINGEYVPSCSSVDVKCTQEPYSFTLTLRLVDFGDNVLPEMWESNVGTCRIEVLHNFGENNKPPVIWKTFTCKFKERTWGVSVDDIITEEVLVFDVTSIDSQAKEDIERIKDE